VRVLVNGEERALDAGTTVVGLLEHLGVDRRYVAVERNKEIVPRGRHAETVLEDGDRIEVVTMVGGG
jgi:thiamine biosynthesis protein ThiS